MSEAGLSWKTARPEYHKADERAQDAWQEGVKKSEIIWSERDETFFLPCEENFNSDTTIRLLDALQTEFGEKICVVLDNASYFTANAVQEFVEDTPIELCYLPRGSPELNPVEECWRQLNQALGNRLFDTLDELQEAALAAPGDIKPPDVFTYLYP
jgi:transposase InsO family protein